MFLTEKFKGVGANAAEKCLVYKKFFPYSHSICCFAVNVCTHKHRGQFRVNGNFAVGLALNSYFFSFLFISLFLHIYLRCNNIVAWFGLVCLVDAF